jgi:hypothetical protein
VSASVAKLQAALESPDPVVRISALGHAAALKHRGRPLAVKIARLLEDPDPAVAWHVPSTFRAVGVGAVEALDVLLSFVEPGGDEMRRRRALHCVGGIGSAAQSAIPRLHAIVAANEPIASQALEALVGIAGLAPDAQLQAALFDGLFSADHTRSSSVARAMGRGPDWLMAAGLDALDARADGNGATLMGEAARRDPKRALVSIERAVTTGGKRARLAMLAIDRLPVPPPASLVKVLIGLAGNGDGSAASALEKLGPKLKRGAFTDLASSVIGPAIDDASDPRAIAELAGALGALAPRCGLAIPKLLKKFGAGPQGRPVLGSWYTFGHLARAIGALADEASAPTAAAALAAALERTEQLLELDESGGLDLQRSIKKGLMALAPLSKTAGRAVKKKRAVDRNDAEWAKRDRAPAKLKPIPKARPPRPPPDVRAVDAKSRAALKASVVRGKALIDATAKPEAVVEAIDRALRAMRRAGKKKNLRDVGDLATLYGDALIRAYRWRWVIWADGARVSFAVTSPKGETVLLPVDSLLRQLRPAADVAVLLTFRMIGAGQFPAGRIL